MVAIDWIIEKLFTVASFFYQIYKEVNSWIPPFCWLDYQFYWLWRTFDGLAGAFISFKAWVISTSERLKDIRSWEDIKALVLSFFPWLEGLLNWFENKFPWATSIIENWWAVIKPTITTPLNLLTGNFDSLKADWLRWLMVVSPTLATVTMLTEQGRTFLIENAALVDSEFKIRIPFLSALSELWDDIGKFFISPFGFLFSKFEDWFWEGDEE